MHLDAAKNRQMFACIKQFFRRVVTLSNCSSENFYRLLAQCGLRCEWVEVLHDLRNQPQRERKAARDERTDKLPCPRTKSFCAASGIRCAAEFDFDLSNGLAGD